MIAQWKEDTYDPDLVIDVVVYSSAEVTIGNSFIFQHWCLWLSKRLLKNMERDLGIMKRFFDAIELLHQTVRW